MAHLEAGRLRCHQEPGALAAEGLSWEEANLSVF